MTDGTEEVDVELTTFDMDHLSEGQPVFKQGNGTRLVLRFEDVDDWHRIPKAELEALADEWEDLGTKHVDGRRVQDLCAQQLREVLEQHE